MTNIAPVNIAMWSGPRNISTALMYSFGNRADCIAWDEPFYGFALKQRGNDHPLRDEIIAANECDWNRLVETCTEPGVKPILYQKHMTHHMLPGFDRSFVKKLSNAFLIRSPEKVLASYKEKWSDATLENIGFVQQAELFELVADHLGHAPPVIDADQFLNAPESSLKKLCVKLSILFDPAMLNWPKGPKSFDGVWAPHWYNAVWQSTGFEKPPVKSATLDPALQRVADEAQPYYQKLKAHSL